MEWAAETPLKRDKAGNPAYKILAAKSDRVYLGKGGFGITYLAQCLGGEYKGSKVVIKTILAEHYNKPEFPQLKNDFFQEALKIRGCAHPHIVQVWDLFNEPIALKMSGQATAPQGFLNQLFAPAPAPAAIVSLELPCMVQEYIQGETLLHRIWRKQAPLPETDALKYIQQIGSALAVLHGQKSVHRDVKPDNIMLRKPEYQAVLIDFGLVRSTEVRTHTAYLTPGYAPPEQYNNQDDRSPKLDVYALAATLYVLLTGVDRAGYSRLEDSRTRGTCLYLGQPDPLQRPERWNPQISRQVADAIWQGMALNLEQRPPTMQDWLALMGLSLEVGTKPIVNAKVEPASVVPVVKPPVKEPSIVSLPPNTAPTVDARALLKRQRDPQIERQLHPPQPVPSSQKFSVNLPNGGGKLPFVPVPGGTLKMQDREGKIIHTVKLQPFYISQFPITQRQYQAIVGENPSRFQQDNPLDPEEQQKGLHYLDRPVEQVTWQNAKDFCKKLSQKIPELKGVSLPSETQWEWAARGAILSKGYTYAGSNNLDEVGWYGGSSGMSKGKTHPVGQLKGNELEIHDMSGNVWEWCLDNWASSPDELPADGTPLTSGENSSYRAVRGGSWRYGSDYCRSGYRNYGNPADSFDIRGFRVVVLLS